MKPKRFGLFPLFGIGGLLLGGLVVMLLWNAILPDVAHVEALTYWQGVGLLLLSRILFGGWRGGGKPGGYNKHTIHKNAHWREKWMNMSVEERLKMREQWRERCRNKGRWGDWGKERSSEQEKEQPDDEELL